MTANATGQHVDTARSQFNFFLQPSYSITMIISRNVLVLEFFTESSRSSTDLQCDR